MDCQFNPSSPVWLGRWFLFSGDQRSAFLRHFGMAPAAAGIARHGERALFPNTMEG